MSASSLTKSAAVTIDDAQPDQAEVGDDRSWAVDLNGAVDAIRVVPDLRMQILLAGCNTFLAGVFMALMDATG